MTRLFLALAGTCLIIGLGAVPSRGDVIRRPRLIEPDEADTVINMVHWDVADGGNGHWYAVLPIEMEWRNANYVAFALRRHSTFGHLATIGSARENAFVANKVLGNLPLSESGGWFWIGGRETDSEWIWVDKTAMTYSAWADGYPVDFADWSSLALAGPEGQSPGRWRNFESNRDSPDYQQLYSVIEWDIVSLPEDTVINLVQWAVSDGGNGHWYAVIPRIMSWPEADSIARTIPRHGMQGYLATITSAAENEFIRNSVIAGVIQPSYHDELWLGGTEIDGMWSWITREPFVYSNWAGGILDNVGIETALAMWGANTTDARRVPGTWNNSLAFRIGMYGIVEWGGLDAGNLTPTTEWINLYCQSPVLDGKPLTPGSIVRAYDSDGVMCGMDTVRADGSFGFLIVYRDDPYTDEDEGADPGDGIFLTVNGLEVTPDSSVIWTTNGDILKVDSSLSRSRPGSDPEATGHD